jgi:tetratricopeptide (TPR) repeat protein
MMDLPDDRRRRVHNAILLHGTSREREEAARLLAKLTLESGALGAAIGLMRDPRRGRLAPCVAVAAVPDVVWDARAPETVVRVVAREGRSSWCLMIRKVDAAVLARAERLMAAVPGIVGRRDDPGHRPAISLPADGPVSAFLAALDAYRLAGFGRISRVEADRRALRIALNGRTDGACGAVVRTLSQPTALVSALSDLGHELEHANLLPEATAAYTILYELALAERYPVDCTDAARWAGRACRKAAQWSLSLSWYGLARRIAEQRGDFLRLVRVLDGMGNTYRERGSFPKARQCYKDAWKVAQIAHSPVETANVALGLMTVEREAGRLDTAAAFGWTALRLQPDTAERANLLLNIGTLLREGGDLDAAESAYRVSQALATSADLRLLAADALAYCSALRGDARAYRRLRPHRATAAPYVRVQIGFFRGAALRALGDERAHRVLAAVERYAHAHGLSEWEMKSVALRESPLPHSRRVIETPPQVSRGLRELEAALT